MTGLFELGPFRPIEAKRGSYLHEEPKAQPTSAFIPLPLLSLELTALTSTAAAAAAVYPLPRRLTRLLFVDPIPPSGTPPLPPYTLAPPFLFTQADRCRGRAGCPRRCVEAAACGAGGEALRRGARGGGGSSTASELRAEELWFSDLFFLFSVSDLVISEDGFSSLVCS